MDAGSWIAGCISGFAAASVVSALMFDRWRDKQEEKKREAGL